MRRPFRYAGGSVWDPSNLGDGTNPGSNVLSNGNATTTLTASAGGTYGTRGRSFGTTDWGFSVLVSGPDNLLVGIVSAAAGHVYYPGVDGEGYSYYSFGSKVTLSNAAAYGTTYVAGDLIGVRMTAAGLLVFYKNGVSQGTAFDLVALGFTSATVWYPSFGSGGAGAGDRGGTINTLNPPGGVPAWG